MSLLPVAEAQARLLKALTPTPHETVALIEADQRYLSEDLSAKRTQPPFDGSAMDGFAVRAADCASVPSTLKVIEEIPAGKMPTKALGAGDAARLYTGSPIPAGTDAIVIQENTTYPDDLSSVTINKTPDLGQHIRKAGLDFRKGDTLLHAGQQLRPRHIALAAAMNHARLPVHARPRVAIISNGDELVPPGTEPGPGQIIAVNAIGLSAMVRRWGGEPLDAGLIPDDLGALAKAIEGAKNADLIVTIGGASVGTHDHVQDAIFHAGGSIDFWRIAMKPGKPLMVGKVGQASIIGLPGNPVSAMVGAELFLRPAIAALQGAPDPLPHARIGVIAHALPATTRRQEYIRAELKEIDGQASLQPVAKQDSSALAALASADCLIIRPPNAPEAVPGAALPYLPLD